MWTRKHLKHQAKKSLKSNYQKMVSVCFLIAFLTTSFASSTFIFRQFRPGLQTIFVQTHMNFPDASNSSIATDTLQHVFQISFSGAPLATLFEHILNMYVCSSGRGGEFSQRSALCYCCMIVDFQHVLDKFRRAENLDLNVEHSGELDLVIHSSRYLAAVNSDKLAISEELEPATQAEGISPVFK